MRQPAVRMPPHTQTRRTKSTYINDTLAHERSASNGRALKVFRIYWNGPHQRVILGYRPQKSLSGAALLNVGIGVGVRIAVIGAGRMGAIRAEDLAPLVSDLVISNRTPAKADALVAEFGGRVVSMDKVPDLDVDGFVVTTATDTHADLLEALIDTGRPILCEKPIAPTLLETVAIVARAVAKGCELQIGFQRRYDTEIAESRRRIGAGDIGIIYQVVMTARDHQPSTLEFLAGSGGIFRDMHVHDFDLVRWMTGEEVATVYATKAVRAFDQYSVYDDADASLIHLVTTGGIQVSISGSRQNPVGQDVRMEVFGQSDSLAIGLNARTPLNPVEANPGVNISPYTGFVDRFRDAFRNETGAFVELAAGKITNPCPAESALEATRIAIACEISVDQNRVVSLMEVR